MISLLTIHMSHGSENGYTMFFYDSGPGPTSQFGNISLLFYPRPLVRFPNLVPASLTEVTGILGVYQPRPNGLGCPVYPPRPLQTLCIWSILAPNPPNPCVAVFRHCRVAILHPHLKRVHRCSESKQRKCESSEHFVLPKKA